MACIEAIVHDGLFDDDLFTDLKQLSPEQLLSDTIVLMDSLEWKELAQSDLKEIALLKNKMREDLQKLVLLLGELYRREGLYRDFKLISDLNTFLEEECCFICKETKNLDYYIRLGMQEKVLEKRVHYSNLICSPCKVKHSVKNPNGSYYIGTEILTLIDEKYLSTRQFEIYRSFKGRIKPPYDYFISLLQEMQSVKEIMVKILRTHLLTKQLEELMDEILDLNGNKISQMKDYLTPEQYRFVRSGCPFEEFPKQQELLANLKKMRDSFVKDP